MQSYSWVGFALLGAVFAAVVAVLSKQAMATTDYSVVLTVQSLLMLITLTTLVTFMRRWPAMSGATRAAWGLMIAGGVAAGLSWFFGYHALQLSHVAKSAPLDKISMPLAVLLAVVFLRERPSGLNWFGIGLMFAGAVCVAINTGAASKH